LAAGVDQSGTLGGESPPLGYAVIILSGRAMSTFDTLTDILVRDYGVARELVTSEANLATLRIDSLSLLELMFKIEDRFGVKIAEDTPTDLVTVNDVVGYIDRLIARRPKSRATGASEFPGEK
jgi:acyl carrier protein